MELLFSGVQGPAVSGKLWDQATDSKSKTVTAGADNASGTHRPGQPIRSLRRPRDRPRAESNVAVAERASPTRRAGGGGSAPTWRSGDRTRRPAGRVGPALRASQAASPVELRGAGVSSRGLGLVPSLCAAAAVVDAEEVGAAQDNQRHPGRDMGGDQS